MACAFYLLVVGPRPDGPPVFVTHQLRLRPQETARCPSTLAKSQHTQFHLPLIWPQSHGSSMDTVLTRLAHTRTTRRSRVSCTYRQLLGLPERSTRRLKHTSAHEQLETAAFWGQACEWAV
jgi:hypothetical protein